METPRWVAGLTGALIMAALLAVNPAAAQEQWKCRAAPGSAHTGCGLPFSLSNFQGNFACDSRVKVGRPKNEEELAALVGQWNKVKASGTGSSWWAENFCAGSDGNAINVVMTELQPTLDFINAPIDPKVWLQQDIPADFPIKVDEDKRTVTVAAGIPQRLLLDYLSEYRHWKEPKGWTLPAFSWWTDQTVGGAVATGTHGSTMKHGSLSSQALSITIITANGTFLTVTPDSNPHLYRALGVSAGRLGVISQVTLRIRPQMAVTKSLQEMNFRQFAQQVKSTQDKYTAAKKKGDSKAVKRALFELDETQAFWIVQSDTVWRTDYTHIEKEPQTVLLNVPPGGDPLVEAMSGPAESAAAVFNQRKKAPVPPNRMMPNNPQYWGRFYATLGREYVVPGTFESRKSYLAMTEQGARVTSTFAPYIQMEVAVPLDIAGDCLLEVGNEIYGTKKLSDGFRNPALVRFTSGEEFYLSNANGGPRMWVNMEDWISMSSGSPNDRFSTVIRLFRDRCRGRFHWGKAGWSEHSQCFDGAKEYPDTWCHYGCAVQELDPAGKFAGAGTGARDVWKWNATRGGQTVPFASCCTPTGFSSECKCANRGNCT